MDFISEVEKTKIDEETSLRQSGIHSEYEIGIITARGNRILEVSASPIYAEDGAFTASLGVFRDITRRRELEDAVKRHKQLLEQQVESRTNSLKQANQLLLESIREQRDIQRKLEIAKEKAEAAANARKQFLANMSHEIRTPLHGILSYSRFGLKKAKKASPEKLEHYFQMIEDSGSRLLDLLNNLLDLSKLSSDRLEFTFSKHDLQQTIDILKSEFALTLKEKSQKLNINWNLKNARFIYDESKMLQVLRNLLSNAMKFTPDEREINIEIDKMQSEFVLGHSEERCRFSHYIRITVSDQGSGIPEKELESIFDEFVQSSRTASGAGGTGLGLSICRYIVHAHNGIIRAHNNSEGGAKFEILLPEDPSIIPYCSL